MAILIVEDDEAILQTLSEYLREIKKPHISCKTVHRAVTILSGIIPRVILLDYVLEDGNASPVIHAVKKMKVTQPPTIVLMSAYPSIEKIAAKYEIEKILKKPFTLEALDANLD